jgi:DNA-binding cell septation regulator SpoVG
MKINKIVITDISIYPIRPKQGLVGFASCVFNNQLSLNSIAIYTRPDGSDYRLVYPQKILPNGKAINVFYPINRETGKAIKEAIAKEFEKVKKKVSNDERKFHTISL